MAVIEFLGLAQSFTGVHEDTLPGSTLGTLLSAIAAKYPVFAQRSPALGELPVGLVACFNEREFTRDPATPVSDTDRILIMSADVGG